MARVPLPASPAAPTNVAPLPRLLAYTQTLGLERCLARPKRGVSALALALIWLVLAWRNSGRPQHLEGLDEPLLAALLGRARLPCARTLRRSVGYFSAKGVRAAVEAAYLAGLPHRAGRVWAALDAHQVPYWGRGQLARFQQGWSGSHSRRLRGYRLYLAVDTDTGQVITYLLARGGMRDHRVLALLARQVRRVLGRRLAGVVADCGFTSKAAVAALLDTGVPFVLGFARSAPVRARPAALSGQQRRQLRDGGAIQVGPAPGTPACASLPSAPARPPTSAAPGSTLPACVASVRGRSPPPTAAAGAWSRPSRSSSTATTSTTWSAIASTPTGWPSASACSRATSPSATRSPWPRRAPPPSVSRAPSAPPMSTAWAPSAPPGRRSCLPSGKLPPRRALPPSLDPPHRPLRRLTPRLSDLC